MDVTLPSLFKVCWRKASLGPAHVVLTSQAFTDNQSLHDAVRTTNLTTDRLLEVELSALEEIYDRYEITVYWIAKQHSSLIHPLITLSSPFHIQEYINITNI